MGVSVTCNKAANSQTMNMVVRTYLRHWDEWPVRMTDTVTVDLTNAQTIEYGLNYQETVDPLAKYFGNVQYIIQNPNTSIAERGIGCISKHGSNYVKQSLTLLKKNSNTINQPVNTRFRTTFDIIIDEDTVETVQGGVNRDYVVFCSYFREKDYNNCYFRGYIGIKIDAANGKIQIGNITQDI